MNNKKSKKVIFTEQSYKTRKDEEKKLESELSIDLIFGDEDLIKKPKKKNSSHPWVEKYRPSKLDDVISQKLVIKTLKNFLRNKQLPHILLYGPPGTGKTSVITAYAKEFYKSQYDLMVMEVNASEERGIEVVRNRIIQFVTAKNLIFNDEYIDTYKLVILDEADAMTADAQAILRKVIEKYTNNARFCLICNYVKKIIPALQSRCVSFRFSPLDKEDILKKIKDISKEENFKFTKDGSETLIKRSGGDMRKIFNIMQSVLCVNVGKEIDSEIINDCLSYPSEKIIDDILEFTFTNSFSESVIFIQDLKKDYGYALSDIITEVFYKLVNILIKNECKTEELNFRINYDGKRITKIIQLLKEIQFNMVSTTDETIQVSAFVGVLQL
jgi:replication factor C subunit 3/5